MILPSPSSRHPRGFLLLEVILALMIFGIAATSFAVALQKTADLAMLAQREGKITRLLETALTEAMSMPTLEEGTKDPVVIDEMSDVRMDMQTTIKALTDMENEDGQILQEMYEVTVTAHWIQDNAWQERSATTWRYGRLYQP